MHQLVAMKTVDHGAGPPYEPVWREERLFAAFPPESGKRFYLGTSISKTWLTDVEMEKWLTSGKVEFAIRINGGLKPATFQYEQQHQTN